MSHKMAIVLVILFFSILSLFVSANPEQGLRTFVLNQDRPYGAVAKHMYKDSKVSVTVSLSCGNNDPGDVEISWLLRLSPCAMEYVALTEEISSNEHKDTIERYMNNPITYLHMPYEKIELMKNDFTHPCSEETFKLENDPRQKFIVLNVPKLPQNVTNSPSNEHAAVSGTGDKPSGSQSSQAAAATSSKGQAADSPHATSRQKRAAPPGQNPQAQPQEAKPGGAAINASTPSAPSVDVHKPDQVDHQILVKTWVDGNYLFIIKIKPKKPDMKYKAEVTVRMFYGNNNYISALDYPLLIFYGVMGLIYILYGLVWLLLLACNWRDLLRVQFWIGAVIVLGMLEKAVFFAEFENINKTGTSVHGVVIFGELVSCLKRTLARMLVIIVSLGFGIVKPRLGQAFHKVLFVGILFFILASIEGCMRATTSKVDRSNQFLLAAVPLAVLDAIICSWIFSSLVETMRMLRLRRNTVKLSLYRHFTNALIFNVLASVAYMIWFMTQHKFKDCIKDWKQLWVDEAFWHVLFVVLLFIIMILWRPTANNQRYAFSPLLDAADEEDDDTLMNESSEGMKMRGVRNGGLSKQRDSKQKMEDDLKWVEDNIPSSVVDRALPSLLDSDDEVTTKYEMSKME